LQSAPLPCTRLVSCFIPPLLLSFLFIPRPPIPPLFPYTTLFRSRSSRRPRISASTSGARGPYSLSTRAPTASRTTNRNGRAPDRDRKSTRLNSSHVKISYAVFCLKKKNNIE